MNPPSKATLRKYGLTAKDWTDMYLAQGGRCPVCERMFSDTVRPVVDHLHILRYKHKKPEEKKRYTRGLLCHYCNFRLLPRGMTRQRAENIAKYLKCFEDKLMENEVSPLPRVVAQS